MKSLVTLFAATSLVLAGCASVDNQLNQETLRPIEPIQPNLVNSHHVPVDNDLVGQAAVVCHLNSWQHSFEVQHLMVYRKAECY